MASWFRRRSDRDFRDEIESHLALEAERQVRQLGADPRAAELAARRAFGNVTRAQERFHDSQRWAWAERLRGHLRYAMRSLRHQRAFGLAAVVTLSVGIGFCTAIFTIYNAVVLRELPVRDAGTLVNVYQEMRGEVRRSVHGVPSMVSYPEFLNYTAAMDSLRGRGGAITSAAVYAPTDFAFDRSSHGEARGEYVSCSYFQALSIRVALGRGFVADECSAGRSSAVAVLSHAAWTRELGSDSTIVGRTVRLNQVPVTVVGVAEPGFGGLTILATEVWVPVTFQPTLDHGRDSIAVRDWSWMYMAARLAPGATMEAARTQLGVAAHRRDAAVEPRRQTRVIVAKGALLNFPEVRQQGALAAGFLAVLGLLVVAMVCANLMNLLLARGISRRREIGIRLAIGASRARLVEQLLTESVLLALLGGGVGLALAYGLPGLARRAIPIDGLQLDLVPDQRVLGFAVLVSVVTAVAFGLVPALQATGVDLVSAFKGSLASGGRHLRPSRIRAFVVGAQVAGSALLLVVAALFIRAAARGASADPGYATETVVSFGLNVAQLGYAPERTRATYETLRDRLAAHSGVNGVALVSPLPLLGRRSNTVGADSASAARTHVDDVNMASVSGAFFATLQIPLLAGRAFTDADARGAGTGNQPVVVSRAFAEAFWPGQSPLGKRIRVGEQTGPSTHTVVAVAADTRYTTLATEGTPFIYMPALPERDGRLSLVARVADVALLPELERAVPGWARELDPGLVVRTQRISERVDMELRPARLASAVSGTMGTLAMLLAIVGIYGVVSYAVSQRTRDIAVRLALGSSRGGVVRLMMREGSVPVVGGLIVGLGLAFGVSRVIRGLLYGISGLDPVVYAGMGALLVAASLLAMYAPARRAARVDPALTLREG